MSEISSNPAYDVAENTFAEVIKASSNLGELNQFMILIAVLGVLVLVLHRLTKQKTITLSVLILLFAMVGVSAYMANQQVSAIKKAEESAVFLGRESSRSYGNFELTLKDVDTLKTRIKDDEPPPWKHAINDIGEESLDQHLKVVSLRLQSDFKGFSDVKTLWPTVEKINKININNDKKAWLDLMSDLEEAEVQSRDTHRYSSLKKFYSKIPLAEILVFRGEETEPVVKGFHSVGAEIQIEKGLKLKIVEILNGDRDIGESEGVLFSWVED